MATLFISYFVSLVVFLMLEAGWLSVAGPRLYKPEIGSLLAEKPRLRPAIIFYLMYVAGLVWLVERPSLAHGWVSAMLNGAILGLVAYGTYDLTCGATMRIWSNKVTATDMAWGAIATGLSSAAGVLAARHFG